MSVKHIDIEVCNGLTSDINLANAKVYNMTEVRRATIAFHQVPAAVFSANITIYSAVKDDPAWYSDIYTMTLNSAAEITDHLDLSAIVPGRAFRFIKIAITNLAGGTLDVFLAASRY